MVFQLIPSPKGPPTCPACGAVVRDMKRHRGSARCLNKARKAMIARTGLVEIWYREKVNLTAAGIPVTVVRDGQRSRWYTAPEWERAVRTLRQAFKVVRQGGPPGDFLSEEPDEKRVVALLRGPKATLEAELAVIALAGPATRFTFRFTFQSDQSHMTMPNATFQALRKKAGSK